MQTITTIGLDIAKSIFRVHGVDADGQVVECLRHGVLLVFGTPCQLQSLAGQEHGRTIPLGDINTIEILSIFPVIPP